jgi:hypothetical protein
MTARAASDGAGDRSREPHAVSEGFTVETADDGLVRIVAKTLDGTTTLLTASDGIVYVSSGGRIVRRDAEEPAERAPQPTAPEPPHPSWNAEYVERDQATMRLAREWTRMSESDRRGLVAWLGLDWDHVSRGLDNHPDLRR